MNGAPGYEGSAFRAQPRDTKQGQGHLDIYPADAILPKTAILRLIRRGSNFGRRVEQSGLSVSDEALFEIQRHCHDFISFITAEANEKCSQDKRKTITGDDIILAFDTMGFDNYAKVLNLFFQKLKQNRQAKGPGPASILAEDNED